MTGWTYSFDSVNNDGWVIKLDAQGNIDWQKKYNKPNSNPYLASDWAHAIKQIADGGYIVLGETDWADDDRNGDIWVFKVNEFGELGCSIETDTNAVPDATAQIVVATQHAYVVSTPGTAAGTPASSSYDPGADTFTQCGP